MVKKFTLLIVLMAICCSAHAANYLTFTDGVDSASFMMKNEGGNNPDVHYSMDGGETWNVLPGWDTIVLEKKNDVILLRGNNPNGFSHSQSECTRFEIYSPIAASGSVMSLIDNVGESDSIPSPHCFHCLFAICEKLTRAPELPATKLADRCYESMFWACSSLTQAPELPATTLAEGCYDDMFLACANLTQAPDLPATTLEYGCYRGMFSGCTSLTRTPDLPATTLADYCYASMFSECTSLTQTSNLPATTLYEESYSHMFWKCASLSQAPEISATTLALNCCMNMFSGCIGLTEAPNLPATTLARGCYFGMFSGCTGLTKTPDLPATVLVGGNCYQEMFSGCKNLSEVTVHCSDWNYGSANQWLSSVSATGTFKCPRALAEQYEYGPSNIPYDWDVQYLDDSVRVNYLTFTAEEDSSSFGFVCDSAESVYWWSRVYMEGGSVERVFFYSLDDGATWDTLRIGETVSLAKKGDKALLRGYNTEGFAMMIPQITAPARLRSGVFERDYEDELYWHLGFAMTGSIAAGGNVMSLVDNSGKGRTLPVEAFFFSRLFKDCTSLTQAPELPATKLWCGCYSKMFFGCTNLKSAPSLPAKELSERCYAGMFAGCSSLVKAPELPAGSMAENCYYGMFNDCTSLTQAPTLPAAACAQGCFQHMFNGCSNLSQIEVNFSEWYEDEFGMATDTWVEGVAPTGTFICPKELPAEYGVSRIPEGWRVAYLNEEWGDDMPLSCDFFTWTENLTICVRGVDGLVEVYNLNGQLLRTAQASASETLNFTMPSEGVYVVKTATGSVKVNL